jgi:hypothetical protein
VQDEEAEKHGPPFDEESAPITPHALSRGQEEEEEDVKEKENKLTESGEEMDRKTDDRKTFITELDSEPIDLGSRQQVTIESPRKQMGKKFCF